jgi:nicotinamide mononucleotide adenylyltransferase
MTGDIPEEQYVDVPFDASKLLTPEQIGDDEVPLVLATCGSFNPIHTGHIAMFDKARVALESGLATWPKVTTQQPRVVGGFLSPVNDAYGKAGLAPVGPRLEICQLALRSHPWLNVDPWEGMQHRYQRTYTVLSRIHKKVREHYASLGTPAGDRVARDVQLVFVCGADLFMSFYRPGCWELGLLKRIFQEMLFYVVAREGSEDPVETMKKAEPLTHKDSPGVVLDMSQFADRVAVMEVLADKCASSTLVRTLVSSGQPVDGLVPELCLPAILSVYFAAVSKP